VRYVLSAEQSENESKSNENGRSENRKGGDEEKWLKGNEERISADSAV